MYFHTIAAGIATVLTIVAFLPQIYKCIKTNSGKTLSFLSFSISYLGSVVLTIFSTIQTPFVWTTLIVDMSIIFLMLPIFFYILKERISFQKTIFAIVCLFIVDMILSIFFILVISHYWKLHFNHFIPFVLAIVGFALTGFAFFPQTVLIIKNKKIGDFSLILAFTYGIAQTCNVIFWIGRGTVQHLEWEDWTPGLILAGISALIQYITITCVLVFHRQKSKLLVKQQEV